MRSRVLIVFLASCLALSFLPGCKKGSPTSPDSPDSPSPPALSPPPSPQYCPPPSQLPSPSPGALTFKGSITAGSERLANVCVYLSWDASQSTGTNSNGEFQFSGIPGSHFIITPSLVNDAFSPSNYELGTHSRDDLDFTVEPASYGSMTGEIAPDFSAKNQTGQYTSLYAYFGQVILVNISADWCAPCRQEAEHLEKLFQDYKYKGFQIITVLTSGDPAAWASEYKLTFPVLYDSQNLSGYYGADWIPLNIIFDRNMTIRYKEFDYDESAIIDTIEKYL